MKKGFKIIDIAVILFIVIIIGIIASLLVKSVIKNIKQDKNKILVDNYANNVLYAKEFFMKNKENNIPKYCNTENNIIYYDENYNNKYDNNELLCSVNCEDESCIKYFITQKDIDNKDIKCNKIIIEDKYIEISDCFIKDKEKINYKYTIKFENGVE